MYDSNQDPAPAIPPIIPEAAAELPAASAGLPQDKSHGFWATIGWTALIMFTFVAAQAVGLAVGAILILGPDALGKLTSPDELKTNGLLLSISTFLSTPAAVGLSSLFARLRARDGVREYLGLKWPGPRQIIFWSLLMVVVMLAMDLATTLLSKPIVPDWMQQVYRRAGVLPLLWLAIVIVGPVGEEFLFRGFFFAGLQRSRAGNFGAIAMSALVWAAIHLQYDLYGIAIILLGGIVLGLARLRTGSLWLCILLHGLMNLVATIETAVSVARSP